MSTREQIAAAAAELRKLIDRLEREALATLDAPTMERIAAFDGHRRAIDQALLVLRRLVQRRVEREQSRTEPEAEEAQDKTAPHAVISKRPTTRPR